MAYTKIIPVRHHLGRCLAYTVNEEKTDVQGLRAALDYTQDGSKTRQKIYVSGFGCDPFQAAEMMLDTKRRWHKDAASHVLAYHVIQSFAPGEVTPDEAHCIGCQFAERALAGYEVTVSTHLDKEHLHNHIVFNSVSFLDGRMFRDDYRGYYEHIRNPSDEICREHGLSIIKPDNRGRTYTEWSAEKQGKATLRSLVRQDVDWAVANSVSWQIFVLNMQRMGYSVRYGWNIKYAAVRHRAGGRVIRLKSLGDGYSEQELREKIQNREQQPQGSAFRPPRRKKYRTHSRFPLKGHYTGFMALYYYYVCLFRRTMHRCTGARTHYLLREDIPRFERYVRHTRFLWEHRIETDADLDGFQSSAQEQITALVKKRAELYKQKRQAEPDETGYLLEKIACINEQLRELRKGVRTCEEIRANAEHIRSQLTKCKQRPEREKKRHCRER